MKSKMNVPNTLSLIRALLVPVFVATLLYMREIPIWCCVVPTVVYILTGLTDMLDGKIARKRGLVTDFGKFMDPLADKFMVIAAMMCIMYRSHSTPLVFNILMPLILITVFRELAVTSIRLIAVKNANIVVPANMLGKIKTVSQIVFVMSVLLEPELAKIGFLSFLSYYPITVISAAVVLVMTVWSGIVYLKTYWKYLDKNM